MIRILLFVLLLGLVACVPLGDPEPTATPEPTPVPTPSESGETNCVDGDFPNGYTWASPNPCLTGEIHVVSEFPGYANSDGRRQYYYGVHPEPYNLYDGAIADGRVELTGVPAWMFAGRSLYRGVLVSSVQIELTEINGHLGMVYSMDAMARQCYNFKLLMAADITAASFDPGNIDVRLEVHTTDGTSTLFNIHSVPFRTDDYEYTWVGFTQDTDLALAVQTYVEVRHPNLFGSVFVVGVGALRAPARDCWTPDGDVRSGVYEF